MDNQYTPEEGDLVEFMAVTDYGEITARGTVVNAYKNGAIKVEHDGYWICGKTVDDIAASSVYRVNGIPADFTDGRKNKGKIKARTIEIKGVKSGKGERLPFKKVNDFGESGDR